MPSSSTQSTTPASSAAAIRRLAERGYDATTAEDLADAVGMSRSTFFRRFGSKDDVVFADHDVALAQLQQHLKGSELSPSETLVGGTTDVLRHLIRDPEAARLRFELMRLTPSLRDRELVITHRYERVYARYLRERAPAATPEWVVATLSAGLVAVHNLALREWLHGRDQDPAGRAARELAALVERFAQWLEPAHDRRRVLVAVYDADGSPDSVLAAVGAQLSQR